MPRGTTYADNAYNRSVGRAGAPMGSMSISRSSGSSSGASSSASGASSSASAPSGASSSTSGSRGQFYADNAYNRSVGRAGEPMGSKPISRSSGSSSGASKSASGASSSASAPSVASSNASGVSSNASKASSNASEASSSTSGSSKVYVDNAFNRRVGRVGKQLGSMPISRKSSSSPRKYVDNPMNRALDRVGLKVGTKPVKKDGSCSNRKEKAPESKTMKELYNLLQNPPDDDDDYEDSSSDLLSQVSEHVLDPVFNLINRMNHVLKWQETNPGKQPQTELDTFKYDGPVIKYEDIDLQHKIGQGGFGDVYFAKLKGSVVAVKKLQVQRVSKRHLARFHEEVKVLCQLEHPHIVKFIGACTVTPNLAIVMEYMQLSLFEALHVQEDIEFSDKAQCKIILHMAEGLAYLHDKSVAHCDMKSTNILLDDSKASKDEPIAKISDFGLSMMKSETETSQSTAKVARNVGTPKYSAPEVLAGEELDLQAMCKTDVYSMSLVAWEVICQEEPFYGVNMHQLKRRLQAGDVNLPIPDGIEVGEDMLALLKECWYKDANKRPSSSEFKNRIEKLTSIK